MLTQLKSLAAQADVGSEIAKMIEEKTREWYDTLTWDQKNKLKDDGLRDIVDELLAINGGTAASAQKPKPQVQVHKSKRPKKPKKQEEQPTDSGFTFLYRKNPFSDRQPQVDVNQAFLFFLSVHNLFRNKNCLKKLI